MNLPPLNSLRVFELVARHGSIRAAAYHLNTSPSTVSEHIKKIEYFLGVSLFNRTPNTLVLTDDGAAYAMSIRSGLASISKATQEVMGLQETSLLRITCVPNIANTWMPAVLSKVKKANSNIDIECDFSPLPRDLLTDGYDAAVRYGSGVYADAHTEHLLTDKIAPVCSPETSHWIKKNDDLRSIDRIECSEGTNTPSTRWEYWCTRSLSKSDYRDLAIANITLVNSTAFAIEALVRDKSIAIMDYNSVKDQLLNGRLVCPLGGWIDAQHSYYFAYPKSKPLSKSAKVLKAILKSFVAMSAQPPS